MSLTPRTILVIDDSVIDREIYARFLQRDTRHSYVILEAETGQDGLRLLAENNVDCIVLDYNLPDVDGLDLLDELKLVPRDEVPVVMLTGAGSEAIAVETMKRGCQDYVVKNDATADGLLRAVQNAIEKVKLRREIEEKRAELDASQREQIELKNRFLSHVSHELRTPLTAVHQFLSLCLDGLAGELNETQREYLEIADRNAKQLKKMIGDLMEVTRADAAKLRVEVAPMDVAALGEEVVSTLQGVAAAKEISLVGEVDASVPQVLADESRIRQVMGNLIENAIKFTPEGGSITLAVVCEQDDEDRVRISVSDTGCGIDEQAQKKVFNRLHQENVESEETRKGLGLGLAICKELIDLQDGRIWVESTLGEGCTFHFNLPVFSLAHVIAPALVKEDRLRAAYSVLRITLCAKNPSDSLRISADQSRRIQDLLDGSVYYPFDVVLPKFWNCDGNDHHYVVAATGRDGMKSMADRIRTQLEAHVSTSVPNCSVRVDGHVEEFSAQDASTPIELALESAARRVESMIQNADFLGD